MSKFIIKLNESDIMLVDNIDPESTHCHVIFQYKLDGKLTIDLRGISMGFKLKKDGIIVHEFSYPSPNVTLLCSNMPYICSEQVNVILNEHYSIEVWFNKFNSIISKTYDFLTSKGKSPFSSWKWNNILKVFQPPVKCPVDSNSYSWDELSKTWKIDYKYLSSIPEKRL